MPFQLVVLFGRPGVGKLTVGRRLAERTGLRLFHNHLAVDLALALFDFGTPEFVELREEVWLASFTRAASSGLPGAIFTFAPESTVRDSFIASLRECIQRAGGSIHWVELTCAPDELLRRLTRPDRAQYGKLRDVATYERLAAGGHLDRPVMPKPDHLVDTTSLSAGEVAGSIAEALERSAPG